MATLLHVLGVGRHTGLTHRFLILKSGRSGGMSDDRPDFKTKSQGLGQYGAKPHYSTLPFWQLCPLKGQGSDPVQFSSDATRRERCVMCSLLKAVG